MSHNRFFDGPERAPQPGPGWTLRRQTAPSALYGANGVTLGPDGRLYVAQFMGNRVSAIDLETGDQAVIVPFGGPVAAPDDVTFDSHGAMFITDPMPGSVWAVDPGGQPRVIAGDLPSANGITCHANRVFVNENRDGGRLLEVFADGREPLILLEDLPHPNAMAVGPDGLLYFPLIAGEIWRWDLAGGRPPERFIDGLTAPPAAKFDARGRLVTISAVTGEILAVDLRSRARTTLATLAPGLDNVACQTDGTLYTSHFISGQITAVGPDGSTQIVSPAGLIGPAGIAVRPDGRTITADFLGLIAIGTDGKPETVATLLDPGFPGVIRGLATGPDGRLFVTTSGGAVAAFDPAAGTTETLADGYDELMGIAVADDGTVVGAEAGGGRVIAIEPGQPPAVVAEGLGRPVGVAITGDGSWFVSDADAGTVTAITGASTCGDFGVPEGIAGAGEDLFVLDVAGRRLVRWRPRTGERETVCEGLPVGPPPGRRHTPLCGDEVVAGPLSAMADVAVDAAGTIHVAANGEGSILALSPARDR